MHRTASHHLAACQGRLCSQDCFSFLAGPSFQSAHEVSVRAGPLPFDSLEVYWGAGYMTQFLHTHVFKFTSLDEKHFDLTQLP